LILNFLTHFALNPTIYFKFDLIFLPEGRGCDNESGSIPELVALLKLVREPSESISGMAVVFSLADTCEVTDVTKGLLDGGEVHIKVSLLLGLPHGLESARSLSSSVFILRSRTSSRPISESNRLLRSSESMDWLRGDQDLRMSTITGTEELMMPVELKLIAD
jgi:hypothetical protein